MKVSLQWLRELVDLPRSVEELVELLTIAGIEVEHVEQRGCDLPNVVIAQIRQSVSHPNADRLSVCEVDDGSGNLRQIVCGAKNYKVGDKVPLALPGAVLPGNFAIKVGKLRGVESHGMMCSPKELNLAADTEGLLILPPDARVGAPIGDLFPNDTILDLEITPNRPDLLSHNGIAREIGALTGKVPRLTEPKFIEDVRLAESVEVAADACVFYSARRITGIKVGSSPTWLSQRLEAIGLRAINNVVDVTNYVMLEMGQPLHAFDAAKLRGAINVRLAREGEQFLALDGKTYTLSGNQLVIADAHDAVAIAGVMGGEGTRVTEATTEILLESADFQPSSVRRTSRTLGLASDSSYRFERGVDEHGVIPASVRAAELIRELAGGSSEGEIHIGRPRSKKTEAQRAWKPQRGMVASRAVVPLRLERLKRLLGVEVSQEKIDAILSSFGLSKSSEGWQIPSFRRDLTREVDLIEEIARVIGMDAIPARTVAPFLPSTPSDRAHDQVMKIRESLNGRGLSEARTLTLISEKALQHNFFHAPVTRVRNPLSEDQVVLRPTLVPGLLEVLTRNVRVGAKAVRLFEIGRVFSVETTIDGSGAKSTGGEQTHLAILLSGPMRDVSWREPETREADLFDLKGLLASALRAEVTFRRIDEPSLGLATAIEIDGRLVGHAGQLWPAAVRTLDAVAPIVFAEVDLNSSIDWKRKRFRELARYPAVTRDIAMIAPLDLRHARVLEVLERGNEPLLEKVELFDVFTDSAGQRVPKDRKSLAYSLTYRAPTRTLTADEVSAAHDRLKERLRRELGVTLRE